MRLGLKGVTLGVFPGGKSYPTPEDDRFWAAAIDMSMPLTVHVGFDRLGPRASQPTFEYRDADPAMVARIPGRTIVEWMALLGLPPALSLTQMIMSGVSSAGFESASKRNLSHASDAFEISSRSADAGCR